MRTHLTILILSLLYCPLLFTQESTEKCGPDFYLEFALNGLGNVGGDGIVSGDLWDVLGYGWGLGLGASVVFEKGLGITFKVNNDVISISEGQYNREIENDLPKVIQQSVYQGVTYFKQFNEKKNRFVQASLCFGWTRYRTPTVKYTDGFEVRFDDVNGFSTLLDIGAGYIYSKRSMLKVSLTFSMDLISYEESYGSFRQREDSELMNRRISIGHITSF